MAKIDIAKIDEMIEASRETLARDTIELVNIKSVQESAEPGAPFGKGPKAVLDRVLAMGRERGFYSRDFGMGVGVVSMKDGDADLGIFAHCDVVPEGEGWRFEPYNAVEYKGCIIGRGATDNKGQIVSVLRLFEIFSSLGIELSYNPAIYLGTSEETGMKDMLGDPEIPEAVGFVNVCAPPPLSLVPDSSFPVGYGGKGAVNIKLKSKKPLKDLTLVSGEKATPFRATAFLKNADIPEELFECEVERGEVTRVSATSPAIHGSKPDPNGNMITKLTAALAGLDTISRDDKRILSFLNRLSLDVNGGMFGIDLDDANMSKATVFFQKINCDEDNIPEILLNIRFPSVLNAEVIKAAVEKVAEAEDFYISDFCFRYNPYLFNADSEVICALCDIANGVTGEDKKPYTLSGGTYANCIPNAIPFGMSGNLPPEDFEKGRGGAHGVDEAVSLDRLIRAMKIYARALLWLDGKDFAALNKGLNAK